jgi:hypothetical protein
LEQQLKYTPIKVNLNIKGNKFTVLAQARGLLRKEWLALRDFRNQLPYDTDDSKADEMKTSIIYYKKYVNNAKPALKEDMVGVSPSAAVDSPSTTVHLSMTAVDSSTSMVQQSIALLGGAVDSPSSMVSAAAYHTTNSPSVALADNSILDLQSIINGVI